MQKAKEAETLTMARMKHRAEVQDAGLLETLRAMRSSFSVRVSWERKLRALRGLSETRC